VPAGTPEIAEWAGKADLADVEIVHVIMVTCWMHLRTSVLVPGSPGTDIHYLL
jgi:hypothetical protein